MSKPFYVTTTIPYVNAPPHIGHALELVQSDVIARYQREQGRTVRFQSGTDENAFKNVLSARALGIPVQQLTDNNAAHFQTLVSALHISADTFVRTTSDRHKGSVSAFLAQLRPRDVYRSSYHGLYCTGCEDFYLAADLVDGLCPDHRTPPIEIEEQNVFFRLSAYAPRLRELIASRQIRIVPETREREVLQFIDRGLNDISISRDAARSEGWGIPYPDDSSQIVYVWIDALINYLSGLGFPDGDDVQTFWHNAHRCHVIGKNVWKFHAIYWPALLLSAGLPVPSEIVVHGFLTSEGRKISKSSGDAINPVEYINRFGVDGLRYFLLRYVRTFEDADFSAERVAQVCNADLSNALGNLTSRLTALCENAGVFALPVRSEISASPQYHEALQSFRFDLALNVVWDEIDALNRELSGEAPWAIIKSGELARAGEILIPLAVRLATAGEWLRPFLPNTAAAIAAAFGATPVRKCEPLFPRVGTLRPAET